MRGSFRVQMISICGNIWPKTSFKRLPAFPVYRWLNLYIRRRVWIGLAGGDAAGILGTVTVQPSGVVLVRPHGRLGPQRAEDGRVGSHEVHVDAGVQLAV